MSVCLRNQFKAKPSKILPECCIKNPPETPGLSLLVIGWVWGSKLPSLRGGCCPHTLLVIGGSLRPLCDELKLGVWPCWGWGPTRQPCWSQAGGEGGKRLLHCGMAPSAPWGQHGMSTAPEQPLHEKKMVLAAHTAPSF